MSNTKNGIEIHVFASSEANDCLRLVNHKTEKTVPINGVNSTFTGNKVSTAVRRMYSAITRRAGNTIVFINLKKLHYVQIKK